MMEEAARARAPGSINSFGNHRVCSKTHPGFRKTLTPNLCQQHRRFNNPPVPPWRREKETSPELGLSREMNLLLQLTQVRLVPPPSLLPPVLSLSHFTPPPPPSPNLCLLIRSPSPRPRFSSPATFHLLALAIFPAAESAASCTACRPPPTAAASHLCRPLGLTGEPSLAAILLHTPPAP